MRPEKQIRDFFTKYRRRALEDTRQQRQAVYRTVGQQRAILKGEAADWFDERGWRWRAFEAHPDHSKLSSRAPKYRHVLNFYQYGWQVLQSAIQTAGIPGSIFTPQNARQSNDRLAARLAKPIIDFERGAIDYQKLWARMWRLFYTDGMVLTYTRHMPDERKGTGTATRELPVDSTKPAGYECDCGEFTEAGVTSRDEMGMIHCPACGAELHKENFRGAAVESRMVQQEVSLIKGTEVVDMYGALECPLPWWPSDQKECEYIPIDVEVKKEQLIAVFSELEEEIEGSGETDDAEARRYRMGASAPLRGIVQTSDFGFRTYGRWYVRPSAFWTEKPVSAGGIREVLLKEYPQGAFVQFCDDIVLDTMPEDPEDHVAVAWAFDMDGMFRPSLGQNAVPIHEAANTSFNQELEAQEFADFPPILVDRGVLTPGAFESTAAVPGAFKYIVVPPGKSLNDCVKQITINSTGNASNRLLERAPKLMELLVGTAPALAGGQMVNARSAQQYETARAQALQRLATPYEAAKCLMSAVDGQLVHEFLRNRTDEEILEVVGERFDKRELSSMLAPRQGRIFAKPEQSESIPQTAARKQAALDKLMSSQNPQVQAALADSNIMQLIFNGMGLPELHVREKTLEDKVQVVIDKLLESSPVTDPVMGLPGPSVPFQPLFDDPRIIIRVSTEWAASPQGMEAQESNPEGFENVKLYVQSAGMAMAQAVDASANPPVPGPEPQPVGMVQ